MFSRKLPLADVVSLCRVLRHNLGAGLTLVRVLEQQAERGPRGVRPLAGRLSEALRKGDALSAALEREKDVLPTLFVSLAKLGDETGHLPEIFGELERYYQMQYQLRRQFRSQAFLPALQFVFAVFLIAGLLYILGLLAPPGGRPLLTFLGLGGAAASFAFLGIVFGGFALAGLLYVALSRQLRQRVFFDRLLLRVPAVGPCAQAFALGRLALALRLTLDSGLSVGKALRLSLPASGNAAYADAADSITRALKGGQTLYEALAETGLFPEEFLQVIASAEESGRVPEVMEHQAEYYHEEAARRLTALTRAAGLGVWLIYAVFMVWAIFRIASAYLGMLGI